MGEDSRVDKGDKDKYGEEKDDDSKDEDKNKNKDIVITNPHLHIPRET